MGVLVVGEERVVLGSLVRVSACGRGERCEQTYHDDRWPPAVFEEAVVRDKPKMRLARCRCRSLADPAQGNDVGIWRRRYRQNN